MADTTVFIVDEDEAVRYRLSLLLKSAGLNFEAFDSAHDFLHSYDSSKAGCLILDVRIELPFRLDERRRRHEKNQQQEYDIDHAGHRQLDLLAMLCSTVG